MVKYSRINRSITTTDKTIRVALLQHLNETHDSSNTAIIPEFSLQNGSSRIDIAVVNGVMHGYELKSDSDTLERLERQIEAYNLVFDKITIVIGRKHVVQALAFIPDWWGITIAKTVDHQQNPLLLPIRKARTNPRQKIGSVVNLLWKGEVIKILNQLTYIEKIDKMNKKDLCSSLENVVDEDDLKKHIRHQLFNRFTQTSWKSVD